MKEYYLLKIRTGNKMKSHGTKRKSKVIKSILRVLLIFNIVVMLNLGKAGAQSNNDFRAVGNGNWDVLGTWQMYNGGAWSAATYYPGASGKTTGAVQTQNYTVTLTISPNVALGLLTINNFGNLTMGSGFTLTVTGNVTVTGTLTWGAAGTSILNIGGNLNCTGTFTRGQGTVNINGNSPQTVSGLTYYNLTINNTASTVTAGGALTSAGSLTTILSAVLDMGNHALSLTILNNDGTIIMGTGQITAATTVSASTTGLIQTQFTANNPIPAGITWGGTVEYNGTTNQRIQGGTYNNLKINNSVTTNTLTLQGAVTVNNKLILLSGVVVLGNNNMTMGMTGVTAATVSLPTPATNSFINAISTSNGIFYCTIPVISSGNTTFNFPVGTATAVANYYPVTLNFSNNSVEGTVGIKVSNPATNNNMAGVATTCEYLTRLYWQFTNTLAKYTYTGSFGYTSVNLGVAGSEAKLKLSMNPSTNNANTWTQYNGCSDIPGSNLVTITTPLTDTTGVNPAPLGKGSTPIYFTGRTIGPKVTISTPTNNCDTTTLTATATGGNPSSYIYNWSGGLSPNTAINKFITAASYILTVTDGNGCTTTSNPTVYVYTHSTAPTSITGKLSICPGESTTLTVSGGTAGYQSNFQWGTGTTPPAGLIAGATKTTYTANPTTTTTYWVERIDPAPCNTTTNAATVTVTVNPIPSITLGPNPVVCTGTTITNLSYTATDANQYNLTWDNKSLSAGFTNISTYLTLGGAPGTIPIIIPTGAQPGVYIGMIGLNNTTSNCSTTGQIEFIININAGPDLSNISPIPPISLCNSTVNGQNLTVTSTSLNKTDTYTITFNLTYPDNSTSIGNKTTMTFVSGNTFSFKEQRDVRDDIPFKTQNTIYVMCGVILATFLIFPHSSLLLINY